jgi:hypothetical protein
MLKACDNFSKSLKTGAFGKKDWKSGPKPLKTKESNGWKGVSALTAPRGENLGFLPRELRNERRRSVKIAFDHEDGDIVAEPIGAKLCCGVIDVGHEVLGG